jgi:hypothetical protein
MRRHILDLAAALAIVLLTPAAANADCNIPPGSNSTIPCGINLVGMHNGVADPRGEFTIVIRDLANNPVAGCEVTFDFGACGDIRIATVQPTPGVTVECIATPSPHALVHATTDAAGIVRVSIVGGAANIAPHTPGAGFGCANVYGGTVLLGTVNVGAFDQNGGGGVNPADIAAWLTDVFDSPTYRGRSDFNCSNSISPADLSLLLLVALGSGSTSSATDYCH